ncbi:MAG TPA: peptidoglycan binding domain-containing protein, partial [Candidatus Limnocylindrales bacterium]|nr:peptidoglycan binding domain-containing protein [Candidatus Limnocylindrales bacterium]
MTSTTATPETTLSLPRVRRLHWQAVALAFLVTIAAAFAIAAGFVLGLAQAYDGRVMPGVRVGGVELAGLDRRAAEARLSEALPSLASGELEFVLEGESHTVPLAAIGRQYELQASLDQAYAVGRSGNLVERTLDGVRSLLRGTTFEPTVRYDQLLLTTLVDQALAGFDVPAVDATASLADDGFWFTSTEARQGRRMARVPAFAAAAAVAGSAQSRGGRIELVSEVV